MADNSNQDNRSLEQDLIRLLQQRKGIGEDILDDARDLANMLQDQTRYIQFQVSEKNKLRSIGREIVKIADQTYTLDKKSLGTKKGIADLAKQRQTLEKTLITLSSLQNKIFTEDKELNKEINDSIKDQISNVHKLLIETGKLEKTSKQVADTFSVKLFGGISEISKKIPGLGGFAAPFEKAANAARDAATHNQLNAEEINLNKKLAEAAATNVQGLTREKIKQLGLEKELGNLAGTAAAVKSKSLMTDMAAQNEMMAGFRAMGPLLTEALGPLIIIKFLVDAFKQIDGLAGDTAKQLGISYTEAARLNQQFNDIANDSGNIFVTTKGINESFLQINAALGTNAALSKDMLVFQTEMVKQAGYSVEAATMLSKLSLATGKPAKEITTQFLGQVKALNITNKTAINEKALLESIAKTSKGILISFAGQPGKLAEAAYQAKRVGLNLEEVKGIQDSLLNIESSIAAEFEAEVLTGKQLNLERARYYALTNNIAGLAQELTKQGIDQTTFGNMNVIQQEAVAKAMGMNRDQMAGMLMDQAAMSKLSQVEGKTAKEKFDNLVKEVGLEEAKKRLGNDVLADQMASASIQDRFNASMEKLKEVFVTLVEPLMPLLDIFGEVFKAIGPIIQILSVGLAPTLKLIASIATLIADAFKFITSGFKSDFSNTGNALKSYGNSLLKPLQMVGLVDEPQQVQDGIAPPGSGPFKITNRFNETAITAAGDGVAVSPNMRTSSGDNQSSKVDYEKIAAAAGNAAAKAIAAQPVHTYFDINEHGRRYQQSTAGQTTRKL
jgi:hypothetical protein